MLGSDVENFLRYELLKLVNCTRRFSFSLKIEITINEGNSLPKKLAFDILTRLSCTKMSFTVEVLASVPYI